MIHVLLLSAIGKGDKWSKKIYPGMTEAIISVLQVSQDDVEDRKVYGTVTLHNYSSTYKLISKIL